MVHVRLRNGKVKIKAPVARQEFLEFALDGQVSSKK